VALGFVLYRMVHLDGIPPVPWTLSAISSLAGAVLMSAIPVGVAAAGMSLLLGAGGISLSLGESFALVGRAQIGKYLPGNVFHYLGRVALGVRSGLPAAPLSFAVGAETALTLAVAVIIGGVGWLIDGDTTNLLILGRGVPWILVALGLLGCFCVALPPVRRKTTQVLSAFRANYPFHVVVAVTALYSLTFVALGIVIAVLARGVIGIESEWNWLQFTWRFALIWVLGLVTIGAPAGLGVREALMLVWFSPALGETAALGLAGLLRLVTVIADLAVFGGASLFRFGRTSRVR
jgi:hypothetical protein